ncbi:P80 family lipoprotein [Mesomycoplasma ovipneumoniae]|uniref:P68 family surface lipoprotein n=1 Tax=Mesomycoplasma ovipneumoniae TaxID=29562 RepID=UPI002964299B|nr:P80 family lipoprotein [Mesomycoplasma ovipneumoniae]MDW2907311.1 P80 family lipoprotein [Mesomycoplasma ovipneumoniae]MDW2921044.1 P80 family lipoprotein [Mesomycoplasma ovipneumoniae]
MNTHSKKGTKLRHKNNTAKKISRIFLSSLSVLAPVGLIASCGVVSGSNGVRGFTFDTPEDGKLVFGHNFSSSGNEIKALNKIIELWNTTQKDKPDFVEMKEQSFQGGYSGASNSIDTFLNTKDRLKLPNIVTNYSSLLAIVNKYSMTFPIVTDLKSDQDPTDENEKITKKFLKEQGIEDFLQINSEIPFLDEKGVYTLPFGKSSEGLYVNKVLFGWIIQQAMNDSNPAKIKPEDKAFFEEFTKLATQKTEDVKEIQKLWKEYVPSADGLSGYEFKKSDIENFSDLQKLSSRIVKAFPKALEGSSLTAAKSVLGIDNAATLIYGLSRSLSENDKSKEVTVLNRKENLISYTSFFKKPESDRYKNLKQVYELLTKGMADKSIYFTTPGEYNSTYFRNHQQLFSIGSTAGFHHNYIRANDKNYKVSFTHENVEHIYSPNARFSAVIKASDLADISKEIKVKALNGKDTVKIKQSILAEIKSLLEKNPKKELFYFTDRDEVPSGIIEGSYKVLDKEEKFKPIVITGYNGVEITEASSSLNEDEMDILAAPHKFDNNSKITAVAAQGPDLIFIHANEKEDRAVKAFVNWILTEKVEFGDKFGKITPIEYFSKATSYLLPLKSTLSPDVSKPKNKGQKLALEQFSRFNNEQAKANYSLVYDNADARSSKFRSNLDSTVAQMQSLKAANGTVPSFNDFLNTLSQNLGPEFAREKN